MHLKNKIKMHSEGFVISKFCDWSGNPQDSPFVRPPPRIPPLCGPPRISPLSGTLDPPFCAFFVCFLSTLDLSLMPDKDTQPENPLEYLI